MPRGVCKIKDNIYVGDNYKNLFLRINIRTNNKNPYL